MASVAQVVAYSTLPYLAAGAGARLALARGDTRLALGRVTAMLAVVVAVPSVIGLLVPEVLHALERDTERIADGQVWRLITSLVQQDSGALGLIGNVTALLVIGSVAEQLLGGRRTALTFLGVGTLAQLPALAWQPVGAGNSLANFGLAGAVALLALVDRRRLGAARAGAVLTILIGVGLTATTDVHGPAVLLGALSVAPLLAGPGSRGAGALFNH